MSANGNKTIFTTKIADAILERLSGGESLRSICQDKGMVSRVTVLRWVADDVGGFAKLYDRAREMQAHSMAEDILDIADNGTNDWMKANASDDAGWVANGENIQRSKLRYEARRWLASKIFPKQYGDKQVTEVSGVNGGPIEVFDSTPSIRVLLQQSLPKEIELSPTIEAEISTALKSRPRLSE